MEAAVTCVGCWGAGSRLLAEVHRKGWVLGDRCRARGASHLIQPCSPVEPFQGARLSGFISSGTVGLNISLVYFSYSFPPFPPFSLSLPSFPFPPSFQHCLPTLSSLCSPRLSGRRPLGKTHVNHQHPSGWQACPRCSQGTTRMRVSVQSQGLRFYSLVFTSP